MKNSLVIFLVISTLASGCGQKSEIKNSVRPEKLASAYGDGKHIIRNLTFPLDDSSLAFKTPLPGIGPIVGGILKFVGDIFAGSTNMGKLQMSYVQPIPELPAELSSVRLKRFFFYMKPDGRYNRFRNWFNRFVMGRGHVTFDFLNRLAVQMSTVTLDDPDNYVSELEIKDYDRKEMNSLMKIFSSYHRGQDVVDTERAKDLMLLRYSKKEKFLDTAHDRYGEIHIIETMKPIETKHFLMDHPLMDGLYKRILILGNSLLIELVKDSVAEESFQRMMAESAEEIDQLEVTFIDTCTPQSCLELRVPDVNLVPIANKGNGLKLDAIIHAGKVPESFKLKGFVEFEVKVDSPI